MQRNFIKKHLQNKLNWNYTYYNVVDEDEKVVQSFDLLIDAKLFVDNNKRLYKNKQFFIQKCHNVSYLI